MTDGGFHRNGQAAPGGPPDSASTGASATAGASARAGVPPAAGAAAAAAAARAAAHGPGDEPVPAGLRLRPDAGARLVAGGSVLVGGSPVRVLRLTPAGARQVASWFAGTPVPAAAAARRLARRLLDAGIAHPGFGAAPPGAFAVPGAAAVPGAFAVPGAAAVTVVIPVRDRHAELDRCLAGLHAPAPAGSGEHCAPRVIVVDDASADPAAIAAIAARRGAAVIHRLANGGPGASRNTGLAAAETDLVAFLDSDCVPKPGWLGRLLPHFADPAVGAVAPRIVPHQAGASWLARYEGASSTLDMGARPSIVRPGARVSYVPGAALVVRRCAAGDGFRAGMYVGEDVDFVWRLAGAGWRVRYEPEAVMGHDHRVTFRAWFARRADYGTSAAALEDLHPGAVRPLYASWWTAGAWAAALAGRPGAAAALTATATALLARRLSRVTGERWPLPVRAGTLSHAAGTPAPASAAATAAASLPGQAPSFPWRATEDNSNKPSYDPGCGVMVDSSVHPDVPNYPPSLPSRDNSKKLSQDDGLAKTVDSWAHPDTPKRPLSSPFPDNSNRRVRARGVGGNPAGARRESAAWGLAVRLAGGGTLAAARPIGSALSRTWWPAAIPAALAVRKLRLPVAALILAPPLLDWADRRPPLDPVRYVAARLLDDAAYSIGVWHGCVSSRTARPLLPVIGGGRQPG
jgi:mycofactocin glycosyltransferase